jgi:hypothetical protein
VVFELGDEAGEDEEGGVEAVGGGDAVRVVAPAWS